jgi:hypothetical protein
LGYQQPIYNNKAGNDEEELEVDLSYLLVADYANITREDKLNVMGIFSNINAHHFPAIHPEMYLVAQLTAGPFEYGRDCEITVKLIDEDATQDLINFKVSGVVPSGERGQKVKLNHFLRLVNIRFPRPGTYEFCILVDNDTKGSLPIEVNQIPKPDEE